MSIVLFWLALLPLAAQSNSLPELQQLADAGRPQLAISLLDEEQAAQQEWGEVWFRWERQRLGWLLQWQMWPEAEQRLQWVVSAAPEGVIPLWAKQQQVALRLSAGKPGQALVLLRQLIWSPQADDELLLAEWRRQVIEAYLQLANIEDAESAWRRYKLDYPQQAAQRFKLEARLLLQAQRYPELIALLKGSRDSEQQALLWLAQLRHGGVTPTELVKVVNKRLEDKNLTDRQRGYLWLVIAEATGSGPDLAATALAYDQAFRYQSQLEPADPIFRLPADRLWQVLFDYGEALGNRENLLIGSDADWLEAAAKSLPLYPVRAKALLVVAALLGGSEAGRAQAHWQLIGLLNGDELGRAQIRLLYFDAERFSDSTKIPFAARYYLQQDALQRSEMALATRLSQPLTELPESFQSVDWILTRALSLVLAGERQQAVAELSFAINGFVDWSESQRRWLQQFVYDLQALNEDQLAVDLLQQQLQVELPALEQGQLWALLGDSQRRLGALRCATHDYLHAADWLARSETGVAQRADVLTKAAELLDEQGFAADARRSYRNLLQESHNPTQQPDLNWRLRRGWIYRQQHLEP